MTYIICMEQKYTKDKYEVITFRLCEEDKTIIEAKASKYGFTSLSDYARVVTLNATLNVDVHEVQ